MESQLVRRRFHSTADLLPDVYASLVDYLEETGHISRAPWDARAPHKATLDDLDPENIARFVRRARKARNFPLPPEADMVEVLTHLNLLEDGKPTNAALLLFGKTPQRFCLPSEVKCAHFHGTEVAKPIPSYQVYKGTAFALVDQAIDFVMSKINVSVGTRELSAQAPVTYEIPRDVVAEAIVNAVAHRDYASNGSVQVMLFSDRLEVWNPGKLPKALTLQDLRRPHSSIPGNPLLAEPLYLTKYIERMGTGTRDMIRKCRAAGLPEPEFTLTDSFVVTIRRPAAKQKPTKIPPIEPWLESRLEYRLESGIAAKVILAIRDQPLGKAEIAPLLGHKSVSGELHKQVKRLVEEGLIEPTIPETPKSRLQKYRLTAKGKTEIAES